VGIPIEACALTEVVARVVGHAFAARAGVRRHHDQTVLGRVLLKARLGDEVLLGAGQAREPVQHRAGLAAQRGRRQVDGELHLAAQRA